MWASFKTLQKPVFEKERKSKSVLKINAARKT